MTVPSTPVGEYLSSPARPGVSLDNRYLVLPRIVFEHLPTAIQHDVVHVLRRIHDMSGELPWPQSYRVEAIRWKSLNGLDETGLRELGVAAELDWNGELILRDETTGRPLAANELARPISESCPDSLYP